MCWAISQELVWMKTNTVLLQGKEQNTTYWTWIILCYLGIAPAKGKGMTKRQGNTAPAVRRTTYSQNSITIIRLLPEFANCIRKEEEWGTPGLGKWGIRYKKELRKGRKWRRKKISKLAGLGTCTVLWETSLSITNVFSQVAPSFPLCWKREREIPPILRNCYFPVHIS